MKVISSDLLRGHIDTFVLSALMDGTKYGNEIRKYISQKTNNLYIPNEQSLYSAYHRLEDMECIRGYWGENVGATRKYYTITDKIFSSGTRRRVSRRIPSVPKEALRSSPSARPCSG